jgi:glucuronoarabinoxylan endo-1,4-beta-xylanase
MITNFNVVTFAFLFISFSLLACGDGDKEIKLINQSPQATTISIDLKNVKQEMVGFGGALTWYSNWMTNSSKKEEIADLLFEDLGLDIIRFKNWYYPDYYPEDKSTSTMTYDNAKALWGVTNELYTMAKNRNEDVKILLSSWGPPKYLKSNNSYREGTLKKQDGAFMYDELATYYADVLNALPWNPDYLSIQNEPTYINSGWTTCEWAASETATLPDYHIAFDKVYEQIKDRTHTPILIGPESQDVPKYAAFANKLVNKDHCGMLAYHPYNINATTTEMQITSSLNTIGAIADKPNLMTEFSDNLKDWWSTANFMQHTLVKANSSGYIYWKLIWNTPSSGEDAAVISVNQEGNYKITPYYYVLKHFSKFIDFGYTRVEASSNKTELSISAFKNPNGKNITLVVINNAVTGATKVDFLLHDEKVKTFFAYQTKGSDYYKELISEDNTLELPARSLTTVVVTLE